MTKHKILIVGDVRGNLQTLTDRVNKLNDSGKGPFHTVFCVGEFSDGGGSSTAASSKSHFHQVMDGDALLPFSLHFILSGTPNDAVFASHHELTASPKALSSNVHYLGQAGVATISDLNVAYLSGYYERTTYRQEDLVVVEGTAAEQVPSFRSFYSKKHVETLLSSSRQVPMDLLLTNEWGNGWDACLTTGENRPLAHRLSPVVADVAKLVQPRHHVASGHHCFYKLAPYNNMDTTGKIHIHSTRFVALGPVPLPVAAPDVAAAVATAVAASIDASVAASMAASVAAAVAKAQPKWFHALSVEPMHAMQLELRSQPLKGATESPYIVALVRKVQPPLLSGSAPFGGVPSLLSSSSSMAQPRGPPPSLSGMDEKRLTRESEYAAKGQQLAMKYGNERRGSSNHRKRGRNQDHSNHSNHRRRQRGATVAPRMDCWFCVASPSCESHLIVSIGEHMYLTAPKGALSPGHMLIVPVSHDSSMANVSEAAYEEIEKYKTSLRQFYAQHDEVPIFVERSITTKGPQHHTFIEAIPMPKNLASKLLPTSFSEESKYHSMDFKLMESSTTLYETAQDDRQYFHIEMPSRIQLIYNVPVDRKSTGGGGGGHKRPRHNHDSTGSSGGGGSSGNSSSNSSSSSSSSGAPPPGYICKICNVPGHMITDCPEYTSSSSTSSSSSGAPPPGYICKICNVPGHLITDCPQRGDISASASASKEALPYGYICNICNVAGHLIKDCPDYTDGSSGSNSVPPPGYVCKICNVEGHLITNCPQRENTGYICKICNVAGHLITECPLRGDVNGIEAPPPGYICKLCNVPGHLIAQCPTKKNSSNGGNGSSRATTNEIPPPGYLCKICNVRGHFIEQCPERAKNSNPDTTTKPPPGYVCNICKKPGHRIEQCPKIGESNNRSSSGSGRTGPRVPLQFARKIACRVLNCPERLHWKNCVVPPNVESQLANEFKVAFSKYDWTIE